MNEIGWLFPGNNGGANEGFNNAAIDTFKNERVQGVVRETIQNSLDAIADKTKPITVRFTLHHESDKNSVDFSGLKSYLKLAEETAENKDHKAVYHKAIQLLDKDKVTFLGIHDYNTIGLGGPIDRYEASGAWNSLVKGTGISYKQSGSALGSYGHGSKAPMAMTEARTVFYFTRVINEAGQVEERFQGKSILQSVRLPIKEEGWTQSTGYFGYKDGLTPLIGSGAIPDWVVAQRPELDEQYSIGTSIYLPAPFGYVTEETYWQDFKVAVVANFYYAILKNKLTVYLQDEKIDASNIEEIFDDVMRNIEEESISNLLRNRLNSSNTVRNAEFSGIEEVASFGKIEWFLRKTDISERNVAVARGTGMLIARNPMNLERFRNTLPFDLFACVVGDEGSQILKELENPEHTEFKLDNLSNFDRRIEVAGTYKKFTDAIRKLIIQNATPELVDSIEINLLDDFFGGFVGSKNSEEYSRSIRVGLVKKKGQRNNDYVENSDDDGELITEDGGSKQGDGTRKSDNPSGFGDAPGKGRASLSPERGLAVKSLRIVKKATEQSTANVAFTPLDNKRKILSFFKSGEANVDTEKIAFRIVGTNDWVEQLFIPDLNKSARKVIEVEFQDSNVLNYALEGRLFK